MEKVWNWQYLPSWQESFWKTLRDLIDDDVKESFFSAPPEYVVSDDLSWLNEIIYMEKNHDVDIKEVFADRLLENYETIRAFHGARPKNIKKYYDEGLHPLNPEVFQNEARNIFLSGAFPELSERNLSEAISNVGCDSREGRVWFSANEQFLVKHCGHYMLYGSEYLLALAAHLGGNRDYRSYLKERGTPTVFRCNVPLSYLSFGALKDFSGMAIAAAFSTLLDAEYLHTEYQAGMNIKRPLPPEFIIDHYHPKDLRDYL